MPSAPLFLSPLHLLEFTRFYAGEVRAGQYPWIDYDESERWHQRIHRDRRVDIWLISWLPTQGTELHDHGGSSGAFTVLRGSLTESVAVAGRRRDAERVADESVAFGPRYVHDVRNTRSTPAVSVHAYSPPLTSMTYYDLAGGRLEPIRTLVTDDPEPGFAVREAS
jgi:mannose-6-phosphate isomerase-like protein (cupin superfamily)